jgi:hypothetical protein
MNSRESIGYASSSDGFHFTKYSGNPVAAREAQPNATAFAEVHVLIEPPLIFAFHTLRYLDPKLVSDSGKRTSVQEDIGVQVLVTKSAFQVEMPIITLEKLAAGAKSDLADCPPIALRNVKRATITARCGYPETSTRPLKLRVYGSADGLAYGAAELVAFENRVSAGKTVVGSIELRPKTQFIKIVLENLDAQSPCRMIQVTVSLRG